MGKPVARGLDGDGEHWPGGSAPWIVEAWIRFVHGNGGMNGWMIVTHDVTFTYCIRQLEAADDLYLETQNSQQCCQQLSIRFRLKVNRKKKVNPMVLRCWVATTGIKSLLDKSPNVRLYLLCTPLESFLLPPQANQPVSWLLCSPFSLGLDPSRVLGGVTWSRVAPSSVLAGLLACSTGGRVSRLRPRHPSSPRPRAPPSS